MSGANLGGTLRKRRTPPGPMTLLYDILTKGETDFQNSKAAVKLIMCVLGAGYYFIVENILTKGETANNEQFLLFPQHFQNSKAAVYVKSLINNIFLHYLAVYL